MLGLCVQFTAHYLTGVSRWRSDLPCEGNNFFPLFTQVLHTLQQGLKHLFFLTMPNSDSCDRKCWKFLHFYSGMEVLSLHFRGFKLHKYNNHMIIWLMAFILSYGIMFEIWAPPTSAFDGNSMSRRKVQRWALQSLLWWPTSTWSSLRS